MKQLAERGYFVLCLSVGWLLRSGKYSNACVVCHDGEHQVRKHRFFYAPLLVWIGGPLIRILNTGVRVLPQRAWEERERTIHWKIRSASVRVDSDGTVVLPYLPGKTLAAVLENPTLNAIVRRRAIELAVLALADFHEHGLTHGDAMADNVMVDLATGVAHWFDFENVHDASRPLTWRRADDLRALLTTCLVRTVPEKFSETLRQVLDVYPNEGVTRVVATSFASVMRRPLSFHLGQAGLSFQSFRETARLLNERVGRVPA